MKRWYALLALLLLLAGIVLIFRKVAAAQPAPAGQNFDEGATDATAPVTVNLEDKIDLLARGITLAEGGDVPGSRPNRNNNPGDLEISGDLGKDSGGYGIFSTRELGDQALRNQCRRILTGDSRFYSTSMTWQEVADLYDQGGDSSTWLSNVISVCGMYPSQTVADWRDS